MSEPVTNDKGAYHCNISGKCLTCGTVTTQFGECVDIRCVHGMMVAKKDLRLAKVQVEQLEQRIKDYE